jgi:adenylate cyclase class IV
MATAKMPMMTAEDIRTEFGWSDEMIRSLLQTLGFDQGPALQKHRRIHV